MHSQAHPETAPTVMFLSFCANPTGDQQASSTWAPVNSCPMCNARHGKYALYMLTFRQLSSCYCTATGEAAQLCVALH